MESCSIIMLPLLKYGTFEIVVHLVTSKRVFLKMVGLVFVARQHEVRRFFD